MNSNTRDRNIQSIRTGRTSRPRIRGGVLLGIGVLLASPLVRAETEPATTEPAVAPPAAIRPPVPPASPVLRPISKRPPPLRRGFVLRVGAGLGAAVLRGGQEQRNFFAAGLFARFGGRWGHFGLGWAFALTMADFETIGEIFEELPGLFLLWPLVPIVGSHAFFGPELTFYFAPTNPTAFIELGAGVTSFPDARRRKAIELESGAGFSAAAGYRFGDLAILARAQWSPPFRNDAEAFSALLMVCASTE